MAYFRTLPKINELLKLFSREQRWLILINADPDAMASAVALKRLMRHRTKDVVIAKVNEIARPDNLAMVRYTRIHMVDFDSAMASGFDRFAIVDSQPHHHPDFANLPFSVIIDHHPIPEEPALAEYFDVRPQYGATSTMLTEYLYNMRIRPGKLLATALQFGIKTDTASFERHFFDVDFRAYQYLAKYADQMLLSRIARSEFHKHWLEIFAKACTNTYGTGSGQFAFLGGVDSPDVLVNIADFFMRVYEIRWVVVSGTYEGAVINILRSDGLAMDVGTFAQETFGDLGSAGGHKTMARSEFPLDSINFQDVEMFLWNRISSARKKTVQVGKNKNSDRNVNKNGKEHLAQSLISSKINISTEKADEEQDVVSGEWE